MRLSGMEASLAKSSSDTAECLWTQSDQDMGPVKSLRFICVLEESFRTWACHFSIALLWPHPELAGHCLSPSVLKKRPRIRFMFLLRTAKPISSCRKGVRREFRKRGESVLKRRAKPCALSLQA
jgi:hypothetical protein